jgi:23S rRNA (guanosine2251-2'-O)-methyltransferase
VAARIGGWQPVLALLEHAPERVKTVFLDAQRNDARAQRLREACARFGIAIQSCREDRLDRLAPETRHQGVVAEIGSEEPAGERELKRDLAAAEAGRYLVLDGVKDPHNLGACLRSAAAAGADGVVFPRDRSASITPSVRKVASGGVEALRLYQVANLARALESLGEAGVWRVGLDERAERSLYGVDLAGPVALVLGGEESGLRELTRRHCDEIARIPTPGPVGSLNVSVAAAVALFEAVRQRTRVGERRT